MPNISNLIMSRDWSNGATPASSSGGLPAGIPKSWPAAEVFCFPNTPKNIPDWWIQKTGADFQEEEVELLIESCLEGPLADQYHEASSDMLFDRTSGLVALMAEYHPDKLPEGFDRVGILLRHIRVVRDVAEWVKENGAEFKPEHIDYVIEERNGALAWLIHYHSDQISAEQYDLIEEYLLEARWIWEKGLVRTAGVQLLSKIDGLVGKMLSGNLATKYLLAEFIKHHPEALTGEDLESLLGSPARSTVRALARHCVSRLDAPGIDRLIDLIWKRDDDSVYAYVTADGERREILTELVTLNGAYLSPQQKSRVIEEDIWGSPSGKLLELHLDDLDQAQRDRIVQKFGYLYV